jgi:hypothetical protein
MGLKQLRRTRRRARQALRFSEWPWRRKVAFGAWVPVVLVGFFLFTGPSRSSSADTNQVEAPKTVTTVVVPPTAVPVKDITQHIRDIIQTQQGVKEWINAMPPRLTLAQQLAYDRWYAARRRQLLGKHEAAQKSSHNPGQPVPTKP